MTAMNWNQKLASRMPEKLANEVNIFEAQIELRKAGKLDEKVFAETRLRRGTYGQRYDNGQRHDGTQTQQLSFPCGSLTKGHETVWDAPGMQRIKIPFGGITPEQLEVIAELAEEYSDSILHITTRQDIQLHYVHIEDTPDLMRRLASVNITTREACGNSVRNITGCPKAGVCHDEAFDITPYARALMRFLLGHPDVQDFGRKFKPAFSGCEQHACGLVNLHDIGYVSRIRDGKRGFRVVVGGGLGAVPMDAKEMMDFCPEEEILPITQAMSRVFARLGEKKNRNKARVKFLVQKLGIEEFKRLVLEERKVLPHDPRWTDFLKDIDKAQERPLKEAVRLTVNGSAADEEIKDWASTNVYPQRQQGYAMVTVKLPLGDLTSDQARALADIARKYLGDHLRTTVEQNIVLRWVAEADLPKVYDELKAIGLDVPGASTITDVVTCPGTDTCKLGIASSRGLAGELFNRLTAQRPTLPEAVRKLHVKMSGCFNSCGQHHIADIGFYGNSRKIGNYTVPHFQVVLGGEWENNAATYGLAVGSVPSKAIPDLLTAVTERYVAERQGDESFKAWTARLGKKQIRAMIEPFMKVPDYAEKPEFYTDWGDPREFTIGDMGIGECAGEMIPLFGLEITKAESEAWDAQVALEEGDYKKADQLAYQAMLSAARALVRSKYIDVTFNPDDVIKEFRERFVETGLFRDKYAGTKFAEYLFVRHEHPPTDVDYDKAHQLVEEAQLVIEACHVCDSRLSGASVGGVSA